MKPYLAGDFERVPLRRLMEPEEAYRFTTDVIVGNAVGRDFAAGLEAFLAKRKPVWPDTSS